MSQKQCAHEGCGREVFQLGKCIFHCEKDKKSDWFTTDAKIGQDWLMGSTKKTDWFTIDASGKQNWNKEWVKMFWVAFREEWVDKKNSDYSYFVFPKFTDDADFISDDKLRQLNGEEVKQSLSFVHSNFAGWADFSFTTFTQNTIFNNARFTDFADFEDATFTQNVNFGEATFAQGADFLTTTFAQGADFRRAIFTHNVDFTGAFFAKEAHFRRSTFTEESDFRLTTFKNADFGEVTFMQSANFNQATFERIPCFHGTRFKQEASFADIATNAPILFRNATIHGRLTVGTLGRKPVALKSITFVDCTFERDANVHIGNIVTDNLSFVRLRNLSSLVKLVSVTVQKHFLLHDSTLSSAELSNIHLPCKYIKIALSSFTKTAFNNVRWGGVERIEADRDTFRQLKAANDDQKNYLQANEFYMREMQEYRKEIEKKEWWKSWQLAQEHLDFSFGDFVSRFSNDWVRPIGLFLIVSFVFHFFAFIYMHWCESNNFRLGLFEYPILFIKTCSLYLSWSTINDFAHFINPLAREAGERYESVYGWWLFHKILGGLIIYQIIISLRRKTRR